MNVWGWLILFVAVILAVAGLFSSVITIIIHVRSLQHPQIKKRPTAASVMVIIGVLVIAVILTPISFAVGRASTPTSEPSPTATNRTSTPTLTARSTPTSSPAPTETITPTPTATATPTPTPSLTQGIKPGQVLYTADFNNKASDWSLDNNWFISNGKLIGKSADSQALLNVPISTTDYSVKASIIITQAGTFGVVARYQSSSQGDAVVLAWVTNTYIALSTCPSDSCAGSTSDRIPFEETNRVYNLSITCKGIHITVLGEGHVISTDDTSNAPAAGNVALFNQGMGVEVLSLQIIAA